MTPERFQFCVIQEGVTETESRFVREAEYLRLEVLLKWVYEQSRLALFERTHRSAGNSALASLSAINHKLGQFRN